MYNTIMVAFDGSASSKHALDEALKIAKANGAQVAVVYVVDRSALFAYAGRFDPQALVDELRRDGIDALRAAEHAIRQASVNGDTELVETDGLGEDVAARLQRYANEHDVDLAVVGTHGRRGIQRMLLGSVAERFVRRACCPVLLIRGERAPASSDAGSGADA
ncbi:universal stress protein [Burkholderia multivorans]|uniref:universal stress protein n=1 Tax=Burkholderia multivorans TaxID=87883 RepID=UPI00057F5D16|nr:universal stress protein [Burkholderia multivorans]KHS09774.1 universal stress protein UspA [Burkholderia multivorans]KHS10429.1 universal stress protein UspA [Burkholderia multivorans]MBJ9941874.1 universal stress protein [Burkholderia multivorans]MBR7926047.1 universal stress protein [Burkholderia multivorans]MBR8105553.1 universal stress protein [Burkholderia multivorans]